MADEEDKKDGVKYDIWDVTRYKLRKKQKERRAEEEEEA